MLHVEDKKGPWVCRQIGKRWPVAKICKAFSNCPRYKFMFIVSTYKEDARPFRIMIGFDRLNIVSQPRRHCLLDARMYEVRSKIHAGIDAVNSSIDLTPDFVALTGKQQGTRCPQMTRQRTGSNPRLINSIASDTASVRFNA